MKLKTYIEIKKTNKGVIPQLKIEGVMQQSDAWHSVDIEARSLIFYNKKKAKKLRLYFSNNDSWKDWKGYYWGKTKGTVKVIGYDSIAATNFNKYNKALNKKLVIRLDCYGGAYAQTTIPKKVRSDWKRLNKAYTKLTKKLDKYNGY